MLRIGLAQMFRIYRNSSLLSYRRVTTGREKCDGERTSNDDRHTYTRSNQAEGRSF